MYHSFITDGRNFSDYTFVDAKNLNNEQSIYLVIKIWYLIYIHQHSNRLTLNN